VESYTREDLLAGLRAAGLEPGQTVFFQSRLHGLGRAPGAASRGELCELFLGALREVLGPEGTLVVPTFTTQVARHDRPYVVEETVPNYGLMAEHCFRHPDFVRSLHPLWSVAASGPRAEEITRAGGTSNFGAFSPFDVMIRGGTHNLFCGLEIREAVTIIHYAELHWGVPYVYNKLLKWRPRLGGIPAARPYLAAVRYLGDTTPVALERYQADLVARGVVRSAQVGGGAVHGASMTDMLEVAYDGLRADPYYFLAGPPGFDYGQPPYDGPSLAGERRRAVLREGGSWDAEAFASRMDELRPLAPRLTGLLRELSGRAGPGLRKALWSSLSARNEFFFCEGEQLAEALLAAAARRGRGPTEVVGAYLQLCEDTLKEQMAFRRTGAYSLSDFAEAREEIYDRGEVMEPLLDGLMLSQLLWDNHWAMLRFARNQFFAPFCLDSPLHVEIGPGHGWLALLALRFGARRLVAYDVSLQAVAHTRDLLESQGVEGSAWELCQADVQAGIPLEDGCAGTLAAGEVLEHIADPGALLREMRRVLRPGGAAYLTTAANAPQKDHLFLFGSVEEVREAIAAADLSVERDLCVEAGRIGDKPLINYAAVLRRGAS
jgi:aminoglycoside 3-N-acetyltransferase